SLITAAKEAGADAVKLQTYTADTITMDHDGPGFVLEDGLWEGRRLYELYQEASTPGEWHEALFAHARSLDLTVFSSPFDTTAVDFLETLDAPAYKIASFEIVNLPLIERAAATKRPIVMSTGMASIAEIAEAIETARAAGCPKIALLQCTSGYPAPPEDSNLRTIEDLASRFETVVGLSDHTLGTAVPVSAIALGASIVEKHFTHRRADGGPDAAFSLEPEEFAQLATDCRTAWSALGRVSYDIAPSEAASLKVRPSLYVVADIAAGEPLTHDNVRAIRPGYGLAPKHLNEVLGRHAQKAIARGTPLDWDLLSERERES
ncbi:MAG: pseudaminic acid synthase, partial [Rhodospirillaceae bacterium]